MRKIVIFFVLPMTGWCLLTSCGTTPPSNSKESPRPTAEQPAPVLEPVPTPAVVPQQSTPPHPQTKPQKVRIKKYTVIKGDILSRIALKQFGTLDKAYYFPIIMVMNNGLIKHPDKIRPGMVLYIPNFNEFMANAEYRRKAKKYFEKCIKIYKGEKKFLMMKRLQKRLKYLESIQ